ncbi:MAG: hypothetical protein KDE56_16990, partial [Anaerolineales bacterium]|nr:hypothetical protein [Anaerolineales bacterium]
MGVPFRFGVMGLAIMGIGMKTAVMAFWAGFWRVLSVSAFWWQDGRCGTNGRLSLVVSADQSQYANPTTLLAIRQTAVNPPHRCQPHKRPFPPLPSSLHLTPPHQTRLPQPSTNGRLFSFTPYAQL